MLQRFGRLIGAMRHKLLAVLSCWLLTPAFAVTIGPISVAANGDDGELWTTFFWSNGEDGNGIGKMYFAGSNRVWCFYRFVLSGAIPSGATVDSALLELWGEGTGGSWSQGASDLYITATDSADASAPTAGSERPSADGGSTAETTADVDWLNVTWTTDAYNDSPDLAAIIQELVDSYGGLASGAEVVIWVAGVDNGEAHAQLMEFAGEANTARLTIDYTAAGGGSVVPVFGMQHIHRGFGAAPSATLGGVLQ